MFCLNAEELFEKLKKIHPDNPLCAYTIEKCRRIYPLIEEIRALKAEKNALILAHSYVHPDIIYGVADHTGDSFGLSQLARKTDADIIVFTAVRFMAQTAKILNPSKMVIDPNPNGGCSLADSISSEAVLKLREQYPEHTFVCYINTTADVKALCDVCVTSSNVYRIIANLPTDKIYFLPDHLMGQNLKNYLLDKKIDKELITYPGSCYVHEEFEPDTIDRLRSAHPRLTVLAHPECRPEVVQRADVVCSTTGIIDHIQQNQDKDRSFLLLTECGIASRLQVELPHIKIVGSCMMCRYMKANSLEMVLSALKKPQPSQIIEIEEPIRARAVRCLDAMFHYAKE